MILGGCYSHQPSGLEARRHAENTERARRCKTQGLLSYPFPTNDEYVTPPYLQATVVESMRLHAFIGKTLERVVPSGGAEFERFYLPAGMKVGCKPMVIHRGEEVYGPDSGVSILIDFSAPGWQRGER
jgi:hypothetical protein